MPTMRRVTPTEGVGDIDAPCVEDNHVAQCDVCLRLTMADYPKYSSWICLDGQWT